MSRSRHGKKPPGWDYWGRRPLQLGAGGHPSRKKIAKRNGIQRERAILKRDLQKQTKVDDDE